LITLLKRYFELNRACLGSGSESCQNPVVEMKSEQK